MNRAAGLTRLATGLALEVFLVGLAGSQAQAAAAWSVRASGVHATVLTAN